MSIIKRPKISNEILFEDEQYCGLTFNITALFNVPLNLQEIEFWLEFSYLDKVLKTKTFLGSTVDIHKNESLKDLFLPLNPSNQEKKLYVKLVTRNTNFGIREIVFENMCSNFCYLKTLNFNPISIQVKYFSEEYGKIPEKVYPFYSLFSPRYQFAPLQSIILRFLESSFLMKVMTKVSQSIRSIIQKQIIIDSCSFYGGVSFEFITKYYLSTFRVNTINIHSKMFFLDLSNLLKNGSKKYVKFLDIECSTTKVIFLQELLYYLPTLEKFRLHTTDCIIHESDPSYFKKPHNGHQLQVFQIYLENIPSDKSLLESYDDLANYLLLNDNHNNHNNELIFRFPKLTFVQFPGDLDDNTLNNRISLRKQRFLHNEPKILNTWGPKIDLVLKKSEDPNARVCDVLSWSYFDLLFRIILVRQPNGKYGILVWYKSSHYTNFSFRFGIEKNFETMRNEMMLYNNFQSYKTFFQKKNKEDNEITEYRFSIQIKPKKAVWEEGIWKDIIRKRENKVNSNARLRFCRESKTFKLDLNKFDSSLDGIMYKKYKEFELCGTLWEARFIFKREQTGGEFHKFHVIIFSKFDEGILVGDCDILVRESNNNNNNIFENSNNNNNNQPNFMTKRRIERFEFDTHFQTGNIYLPNFSTHDDIEFNYFGKPDEKRYRNSGNKELFVDISINLHQRLSLEIIKERKDTDLQKFEEWVKNEWPKHETHGGITDKCILETSFGVDHEIIYFQLFDCFQFSFRFYECRGRNNRGAFYIYREFGGDYLLKLQYIVKPITEENDGNRNKNVSFVSSDQMYGFQGLWGFPEIQFDKLPKNRDGRRRFEVMIKIKGVIPLDRWAGMSKLIDFRINDCDIKRDAVIFNFIVNNEYSTTQIGVRNVKRVDLQKVNFNFREEMEEEEDENEELKGVITLCGIEFSVELFPLGHDGTNSKVWISFRHQYTDYKLSGKFFVKMLDIGDDDDFRFEYEKSIENGEDETMLPLCDVIENKKSWKFYVRLEIENFSKAIE